MYSKEELKKIDDRLKKASKKLEIKEDFFWNNEYPAMSKEEQAKCWAADMHRSMRDRAEYGYIKYGSKQ
jgi:hypothetical protein